jgi:hypothetical protein
MSQIGSARYILFPVCDSSSLFMHYDKMYRHIDIHQDSLVKTSRRSPVILQNGGQFQCQSPNNAMTAAAQNTAFIPTSSPRHFKALRTAGNNLNFDVSVSIAFHYFSRSYVTFFIALLFIHVLLLFCRTMTQTFKSNCRHHSTSKLTLQQVQRLLTFR